MRLWSRRAALVGGGGILGLGALTVGGSLAVCASGAEPKALVMIRPLFVGLANMHAPGQVGRGLLDEVTPDRLLQDLTGHADLAGIALYPDSGQRRRALDQIYRRDFARGDTVVVENWIMSRTETRIAAAWVLWGDGRI